MVKKTSKKRKKGLLLPFAGEENAQLGRDFLKSPEAFLEKNNLSWEDIECPREVHEALQRAKKFEDEIGKVAIKPSKKSITQLKKLASKHFGKDYEVSLIPFGLKFREHIEVDPGVAWTATGTASVTFLDSDADTDG
jgi:hypothetical protein